MLPVNDWRRLDPSASNAKWACCVRCCSPSPSSWQCCDCRSLHQRRARGVRRRVSLSRRPTATICQAEQAWRQNQTCRAQLDPGPCHLLPKGCRSVWQSPAKDSDCTCPLGTLCSEIFVRCITSSPQGALSLLVCSWTRGQTVACSIAGEGKHHSLFHCRVKISIGAVHASVFPACLRSIRLSS